MNSSCKILELLEKDSTLSYDQIAVMLNIPIAEVESAIKGFEEDKTITAYKAVINWSQTEKQSVSALIELKVTPQRGRGFDKIAERINNYPEVKSVLLMSGAYDLAVLIEAKTMAEISNFVWEHLATMDSVVSTSTHFVLKKYKEDGVSFISEPEDERSPNFI